MGIDLKSKSGSKGRKIISPKKKPSARKRIQQATNNKIKFQA
jgi:hypothetical protein